MTPSSDMPEKVSDVAERIGLAAERFKRAMEGGVANSDELFTMGFYRLSEARTLISSLCEKIEYKAEAAQISRSVEEHNLRRALAAERDRDEAAALIDTLQRERNKLVLSVGEHVTKRSEYLARAEAAEAEVTRLREALEPFAEHDTGAVEAVGIFSIPDEHPLLGTGLGNDWRPSITVGDFRRARSALSKDTP